MARCRQNNQQTQHDTVGDAPRIPDGDPRVACGGPRLPHHYAIARPMNTPQPGVDHSVARVGDVGSWIVSRLRMLHNQALRIESTIGSTKSSSTTSSCICMNKGRRGRKNPEKKKYGQIQI
jgi:hypothetical protein